MKIFGFIFAVLLLIGTAASLQSTEITSIETATITLDPTTLATDTLDSVAIGPFKYDMGLMGMWVQMDTLISTTVSAGTGGGQCSKQVDSIHIYWRIPGKGVFWRPVYVDTMKTNGAAPGYITTGAGVSGVTLMTGQPKYAVFYDPANPMPIPLLSETETIELYVHNTTRSDSAYWKTRYTFYLRSEKDIP